MKHLHRVIIAAAIAIALMVFPQLRAFADSATVSVAPVSGSYHVGDTFSAQIKAQSTPTPFAGVQATVAISPNLSLQDVKTGDCSFTFITTPSITSPSFAGAIFGGSSANCTVYTATLKVVATGTGTISLSDLSVRANSTAQIIPSTAVNGSYILIPSANGTTSLPTPTQGASQPTYSVDILVQDPEGHPLPNVKVAVPSATAESITDQYGVAHFDHLPQGVYSVVIDSANGAINRNISVHGNQKIAVKGVETTAKSGNSAIIWGILLIILAVIIIVLLIKKYKKSSLQPV